MVKIKSIKKESSFGKEVSSRRPTVLEVSPTGMTIWESWHFENAYTLLTRT